MALNVLSLSRSIKLRTVVVFGFGETTSKNLSKNEEKDDDGWSTAKDFFQEGQMLMGRWVKWKMFYSMGLSMGLLENLPSCCQHL